MMELERVTMMELEGRLGKKYYNIEKMIVRSE